MVGCRMVCWCVLIILGIALMAAPVTAGSDDELVQIVGLLLEQKGPAEKILENALPLVDTYIKHADTISAIKKNVERIPFVGQFIRGLLPGGQAGSGTPAVAPAPLKPGKSGITAQGGAPGSGTSGSTGSGAAGTGGSAGSTTTGTSQIGRAHV
jgi:hypothetical protein